jgi:tripartite-type tricarboxylate transporter receptor subunit TctC
MNCSRRRIATLMFLCLALYLVPSAVYAQADYPTKPIQIISPYAAGGSSDLHARIMAEKLRELLGQPVLVLNKPGAGTALGAGYVANSKPDGYNLYCSAAGIFVFLHALNPGFTNRLSDFAPIASTSKYPQIVVAGKDVPVQNVKEMVEYIKKNPGKLTYCSVGIGSSGHLLWESLKHSQNLDIQHVPYTGVNPALTALVGGHANFAIFPFSSLIVKQAQAKAIKILGIAGSKSPFLPDVKTTTEQGFPELFYDAYMVFCAPAKTPPAILKKLESAIQKANQDKGVREKLNELGLEPDFLNTQATQKYLESELKWVNVIKRANIITK